MSVENYGRPPIEVKAIQISKELTEEQRRILITTDWSQRQVALTAPDSSDAGEDFTIALQHLRESGVIHYKSADVLVNSMQGGRRAPDLYYALNRVELTDFGEEVLKYAKMDAEDHGGA